LKKGPGRATRTGPDQEKGVGGLHRVKERKVGSWEGCREKQASAHQQKKGEKTIAPGGGESYPTGRDRGAENREVGKGPGAEAEGNQHLGGQLRGRRERSSCQSGSYGSDQGHSLGSMHWSKRGGVRWELGGLRGKVDSQDKQTLAWM